METDLFLAAYAPRWSEQLEYLASIAMPEPWKFKNPSYERKNAEYAVLERYLFSVFRHQVISAENAFSPMEADQIFFLRSGYACFHTGLMSRKFKDIYAFFERNRYDWASQDWVLKGFYDDTSPAVRIIGTLPLKPYSNLYATQSCFRPDWPIRVNVQHILESPENLSRIPEAVRGFGNLPLLLEAGVEAARRTASYTPSIVVPQLYQNRIQFLLPICLLDPGKPDIALTISEMEDYYLGNTCLTLEMTYCNARQLARPTAPWLTSLVE